MTDLPRAIGFAHPAYVDAIPESERAGRVHQEEGTCEIDGEHFFVRARLQIPVVDGGDAFPFFEWSVWVSLGGAAYVRLCEEDPETQPPPAVGFLATRLPGYDDTLDLKAMVHAVPGEPPVAVLVGDAHPLAIEQREGVTRERVYDLVTSLATPPPAAS